MTAEPIRLRPRYPTGLLQDHPPLRSEAEVAADIAARRFAEERDRAMRVARYRMRFLLVDGCRINPFEPFAKLIASRATEPTRRQPNWEAPERRPLLGRLFGSRR
jgi:hypothetical protein